MVIKSLFSSSLHTKRRWIEGFLETNPQFNFCGQHASLLNKTCNFSQRFNYREMLVQKNID